jgi:hypothetical protein
MKYAAVGSMPLSLSFVQALVAGGLAGACGS